MTSATVAVQKKKYPHRHEVVQKEKCWRNSVSKFQEMKLFLILIVFFRVHSTREISFCCRRTNWAQGSKMVGWSDNCYKGRWQWTEFEPMAQDFCYTDASCSDALYYVDVPSSYHYIAENIVQVNQPCNTYNQTVNLNAYEEGDFITIQSTSIFSQDNQVGFILQKYLYFRNIDQVSSASSNKSLLFLIIILLLGLITN